MTEQLKTKLTAEEASRIIAADLKAYPKDGPDKLGEHLRLFSEVLPRGEIEALWEERYTELHRLGVARPCVQIGGRRYPAEVWDEHRRKLRAKGEEAFSVACGTT
jgi:hypothetical protein